jgi:hypothetical protein
MSFPWLRASVCRVGWMQPRVGHTGTPSVLKERCMTLGPSMSSRNEEDFSSWCPSWDARQRLVNRQINV